MVLYYLMTLIESVLGIFGVRALYEQPAYTVVRRLDRGVEIRSYEPRLAVETDARGQGDGEAFGRLFRYITGANRAADRIAMTAPVETGGRRVAMTVPVERGAGGSMRFFLPRKVAEAGAPEPTEPGIRLVPVPAERIAVLRFSGRITPEGRAEQEAILLRVLAAAGLEARPAEADAGSAQGRASQEGPGAVTRPGEAAHGSGAREAPVFMGYDPPFAIPFLRRNEVAVRLDRS